MAGDAHLNIVTGILDAIELWLVEAGCPLTSEQAAEFAKARTNIAAEQTRMAS